MRGDNGWSIARALSAVADEVVSALYDYTTTHIFRARNPTEGERFAVLAVGGYGRGELAPFSDLDLLFLHPYKPTPFSESVTEYMLYALWDLRLKIGHASRNIDEALKLAREDQTVRTAMMEARLIAGDASLARDLATRLEKDVIARDRLGYVAEKLRERDSRHARIGASRYMVEPNIKEGKGGLRDLHTMFWMARHCYGETYVDVGFSADEQSSIRRALSFLWRVRCHLHLAAGRAEEKLTFDLQPELAKRMGYAERAGRSSVERFMTRYFLVAKDVGALMRVLCAKLERDNAKRAPRGLQRFLPGSDARRAPVEPGFHVEAGRLNVDAPLDTPGKIMRLFALAANREMDVHPEAIAEAERASRRMPRDWRQDNAARAAFLEAACSQNRPGVALRLMNEAGVLGRFMPEFGRIVAQMQFNMYHHYTVDEHTLKAVEAISEIEHGRHRAQHPLATEIFPKIINRRALYLAMLLHDTGKGDGDQQIAGRESAIAACERLGLPAEEVELVGWLVGNHLVMSDIAQKRDVSDPRTVARFAEIVGNVERLRLLLVLTVADIRAVGPSVWNDWKGQLLRDLYGLTEAALRGGRSDEESVRAHFSELALAAKARLTHSFGPDTTGLSAWLDALDDGYWASQDEEALAWQAREALEAQERDGLPHAAARFRKTQSVTEFLVIARDRPGLFASLAAAISASGANIAGARVHTTQDGRAVDVFSVQTADGAPFGEHHGHALTALVAKLREAAVMDFLTPASAPASRRASAFKIEPWVRIDNSIATNATVIEASGRDRLGLLASLARICADAGLSIVSAHIDTAGVRASDVFYVQELDGGPVKGSLRIAALREELEAALRAGEPAAPAGSASAPLAVAPASTAR